MRYPIILYLTLPAWLLLVFVSCVGVWGNDLYATETLSWQAQSYGQDRVDLFLVAPVWIISAWFAAREGRGALLMWGGVSMYLLYTFVIYCFDVHFNKLFICYILVLGCVFYSVMYFFYRIISDRQAPEFPRIIDRVTGIFFLVVAVLFYFLWLADIVPSLKKGVTPPSLMQVGLPTNPVHVIDLAIFLPFLFITGLLSFRGKRWGRSLAITALSFCVLMDMTIGYLTLYMQKKNVSDSISVAYIMAALVLISGVLLVFNLKQIQKEV